MARGQVRREKRSGVGPSLAHIDTQNLKARLRQARRVRRALNTRYPIPSPGEQYNPHDLPRPLPPLLHTLLAKVGAGAGFASCLRRSACCHSDDPRRAGRKTQGLVERRPRRDSQAARYGQKSTLVGQLRPEHNGCKKSDLARGGVKRSQAGKITVESMLFYLTE